MSTHDIPHAVLSQYFQERMQGRRLVSAVFLTFRFEPGFFEQEVLPVLLDIPLSHAVPIRLVQLEDALRGLPGEIAVYYDTNGLVIGDSGSAKLDIRRISVQHRAIFHPKNVFVLTESAEPDESGQYARTLLVASLSANLTRAGWWENLEICHLEEIGQGESTRLKDDLIGFIEGLRRKAVAAAEHQALNDVLGFLRQTEQRLQRSTGGRLHTHFYTGRQPFVDFLDEVAGDAIRGTYLEIVSPYFDDAKESRPLFDIIERFGPREVRIFLPREANGAAACRKDFFEGVRAIPGVGWGRLPADLLRMGKREDAAERMVHAKVYRFFTQQPKREILFVGSVNLTRAAHQSGGNVETGFLVEVEPVRRPEFWLDLESKKPREFETRTEDEGAAAGGLPLVIRYHWDKKLAEALWNAPTASPPLRVSSQGVNIAQLNRISPRAWTRLDDSEAARLGEALQASSFVSVTATGKEPVFLLVQEEGMSHRPALLLQLDVADILRYWSLLTIEQRTAFIETHAPDLMQTVQGADLVARWRADDRQSGIFDRVAGFFHAFGCLERTVRDALERGNERDATYRLFGRKYDSLGFLLEQVLTADSKSDAVDAYLIVLCARQLCQEIRKTFPDFWQAHRNDAAVLDSLFANASVIRDRLIASSPEPMQDFIDWFEGWFLRRATPVEVTP